MLEVLEQKSETRGSLTPVEAHYNQMKKSGEIAGANNSTPDIGGLPLRADRRYELLFPSIDPVMKEPNEVFPSPVPNNESEGDYEILKSHFFVNGVSGETVDPCSQFGAFSQVMLEEGVRAMKKEFGTDAYTRRFGGMVDTLNLWLVYKKHNEDLWDKIHTNINSMRINQDSILDVVSRSLKLQQDTLKIPFSTGDVFMDVLNTLTGIIGGFLPAVNAVSQSILFAYRTGVAQESSGSIYVPINNANKVMLKQSQIQRGLMEEFNRVLGSVAIIKESIYNNLDKLTYFAHQDWDDTGMEAYRTAQYKSFYKETYREMLSTRSAIKPYKNFLEGENYDQKTFFRKTLPRLKKYGQDYYFCNIQNHPKTVDAEIYWWKSSDDDQFYAWCVMGEIVLGQDDQKNTIDFDEDEFIEMLKHNISRGNLVKPQDKFNMQWYMSKWSKGAGPISPLWSYVFADANKPERGTVLFQGGLTLFNYNKHNYLSAKDEGNDKGTQVNLFAGPGEQWQFELPSNASNTTDVKFGDVVRVKSVNYSNYLRVEDDGDASLRMTTTVDENTEWIISNANDPESREEIGYYDTVSLKSKKHAGYLSSKDGGNHKTARVRKTEGDNEHWIVSQINPL